MTDEHDEEIFNGELDILAQHRISIPSEVRKREGIGPYEEYILEVRTETGREMDRVETSTAKNSYRINLPEKYHERYNEGDTLDVSLWTINRGTSALDF